MHQNIRLLLAVLLSLGGTNLFAQNVGIGTTNPLDKLHVDSGNIRIGKDEWGIPTNSRFLKIGDGDYITLGEEEADDKLTIKAKEVFIRPSGLFTTVPVSIQGSNNFSHFFFGANEDTYIRAGKNNGNVILNDIAGGKVGVGVFPSRAMLEQYGSVGNTAAIFGGDGAGISLQKNWPGIGFNHWYDGNHRTIGPGYAAQMVLNQANGSMYYTSWNQNAATANGLLLGSTQNTHFFISRFGKIGLGTDNPQADIEIITPSTAYEINPNIGLKITNPSSGSWNMHTEYWGNLLFLYNGIVKASVSAVTGSWNTISDAGLKKNVTSLNNKNILEKVILLSPVTYLMKEEKTDDKYHLGFISQEVEKIFPEVITEFKGIKMMNYSGLIPVTVQAVKEQQQQIETLQKENTDLKKRMDRLEKLLLKQ